MCHSLNRILEWVQGKSQRRDMFILCKANKVKEGKVSHIIFAEFFSFVIDFEKYTIFVMRQLDSIYVGYCANIKKSNDSNCLVRLSETERHTHLSAE